MRFGINTFLFTSPFTNKSTKLFPQFKKWGFETIEIPVEDPSHIDPEHVKAELDKTIEALVEGHSLADLERAFLAEGVAFCPVYTVADIAAGKIDIVVVYKVDRLTRSLLDFAKLVEAFDRRYRQGRPACAQDQGRDRELKPVEHARRVNAIRNEGIETPDALGDVLEPQQGDDLGLAQALCRHRFADQGLKCVHAVPYGKTPSMAVIYLDFNGVVLRYLGIAVAEEGPVPPRQG